jgi:hypothetical protein
MSFIHKINKLPWSDPVHPHGSLSQLLTEGFIVPRASHKAVTSYACRGRKLSTKRQDDS